MPTKPTAGLCGFIALALLLGGCAGHDVAGGVSDELLAHTIEYENQMIRMARAAERHAGRINDWALTANREALSLRRDGAVTAAAEDAVDRVPVTGLSGEHIRDFIADYVSENRRSAQIARAKAAEIEARTLKTTADLQREIKPLASVRAKLETLRRGPSFRDQVAALRPVLDTIKQRLTQTGDGGK